MAVASAGLYAGLHLAPDRQPRKHPTTHFFTGRMPFLPPNQQRQSTEGTTEYKKGKGSRGKGSRYSITERRVPELIPVLGSQPAGDVNHKPDGRLPLLSARPAVTPAALKRAATNFAA